MRDDLLDAKAAIDWAVAQLPSLESRFKAWESDSPYRIIVDPHPETGQKLIKLADVKPLPAIINAEVGAVINSIRSSLDILITSIAIRHGCGPKELEHAYFPIAKSSGDFTRMNYKGSEVIHTFPQVSRDAIESFQPWRGGNNLLVALHDLDIRRKHRRLIDARADPVGIGIGTEAYAQGLRFVNIWPGLKNDAVIGWTDIHATNCEFDITLFIAFDEADALPGTPVLDALRNFAGIAYRIINRFDT